MHTRHQVRKVLIIVENLPVPFDRRVWQEARTLHGAGYEVSVICPKAEGYQRSREVLEGIHIYRHPLPFEASRWYGYLLEYSIALFFQFLLAWRVFVTRGFDVVHACNPPDNICLIGGFFKVLFGTKFIFDHHDLSPELYEAKGGRRGSLLYRMLSFWERLTFKLADVSIATNDSYRRIAIERGGMPPDRVFVVRSGPDLERLRIEPSRPNLKHGRSYLVGYVGVMGAQEGIPYLLKAARYIVHDLKREDVHFTLVGGGTELAALRTLALDLGLAEYVNFTGRIPDEELLSVLNTADVCINPDEFNKLNDSSTMNKILEYMALAKPIVQFDMTEGRVSAGEAALYASRNDPVDLARQIVVLLDDPRQRAWRGSLGRERIVNDLNWETQAPILLRVYESLGARRIARWHSWSANNRRQP